MWRLLQVKINNNFKNIFSVWTIAILLTPLMIYCTPDIANSVSSRWQYKRYKVPTVGVPNRTDTQGSRGDCPVITPITPQVLNPQNQYYSFSTTVSEYPTLFFHIGEHKQPLRSFPVKFVLKDDQNKTLYQKNFQLIANRRIIDINLPAYTNLKPLTINQNYQWSLTIDCSENNPVIEDENSETIESHSTGLITRVSLPPEFAAMTFSPENLPSVYANFEIWQDALMSASQLRRLQPQNSQGINEWNKLFSLIGLEKLANDQF